MEYIYIIVIVLVILLFVMYVILNKINKSEEPKNDKIPYKVGDKLLTDKELKFYQSLKPITDELGYNIMCKVRLADLAVTPPGISQYMKWFNYVRSKHVDFVICSGDTTPLFVVEVDDRSHDKERNKKNDDFKNRIFEGSSIKLLRYRTWTKEQLIQDFSPKTTAATLDDAKTTISQDKS